MQKNILQPFRLLGACSWSQPSENLIEFSPFFYLSNGSSFVTVQQVFFAWEAFFHAREGQGVAVLAGGRRGSRIPQGPGSITIVQGKDGPTGKYQSRISSPPGSRATARQKEGKTRICRASRQPSRQLGGGPQLLHRGCNDCARLWNGALEGQGDLRLG